MRVFKQLLLILVSGGILSFAEAKNDEPTSLICQQNTSPSNKAANTKLVAAIVAALREQSKDQLGHALTTHPYGLKTIFVAMIHRTRNFQAENKIQSMHWGSWDVTGTKTPVVQNRIIDAWVILRDALDPRSRGAPVTPQTVSEIMANYQLLPALEDEVPPQARVRNPRRQSRRFVGDGLGASVFTDAEKIEPTGEPEFWKKMAIKHGLKDRLAKLRFNRKSGAPWEGEIQIPAEVAALTKFGEGLNIEQIEEWIGQFKLAQLKAKDAVVRYQFEANIGALKLVMEVQYEDRKLTLMDLYSPDDSEEPDDSL